MGKHVFKVRSVDSAGNIDPTPEFRVWEVLSVVDLSPPTTSDDEDAHSNHTDDNSSQKEDLKLNENSDLQLAGSSQGVQGDSMSNRGDTDDKDIEKSVDYAKRNLIIIIIIQLLSILLCLCACYTFKK